jgi:hypothetical protein
MMDIGRLACALALLAAAPAGAQQWFTLTPPSTTAPEAGAEVEVDLSTVRVRNPDAEAVIRVTHRAPQAHAAGFEYRSYVAIAQFDCARRSVALVGAAYYGLAKGQGPRLEVDTAARERGMPNALLDSLPPLARQALLKATCGQ